MVWVERKEFSLGYVEFQETTSHPSRSISQAKKDAGQMCLFIVGWDMDLGNIHFAKALFVLRTIKYMNLQSNMMHEHFTSCEQCICIILYKGCGAYIFKMYSSD